MKKNNTKTTGWAWLCDFGLCQWAAPTKKMLLKEKKPSPEAKPVKVIIVLRSEWAIIRKP